MKQLKLCETVWSGSRLACSKTVVWVRSKSSDISRRGFLLGGSPLSLLWSFLRLDATPLTALSSTSTSMLLLRTVLRREPQAPSICCSRLDARLSTRNEIFLGNIICAVRLVVWTLDLRSWGRGFDSRSGRRYQVVTTWMGDCLSTSKPSPYITSTKANSAFHPSGVGKSSTGLSDWAYGRACLPVSDGR